MSKRYLETCLPWRGHPCQMWKTLLLHIPVVTVYWIYDMCSRALLTMLLEYPISPAPREGEMVNKHFSQTSTFLSQKNNLRWIFSTFLSQKNNLRWIYHLFLAVPRQLFRFPCHWLTDSLTFEKHYQRALWETCDPWDMWSEWWGDMT